MQQRYSPGLTDTEIDNDYLHSIIEQLKTSLEELYVLDTDVDFATLFELKSMPALKTLICSYPLLMEDDYIYVVDIEEDIEQDIEQVENLKQHLPHVYINEERNFVIASPLKENQSYRSTFGVFCNQWIWEIRAKEQNLFAKQDRRITTSDFYLLRMPIDNNAEMDGPHLSRVLELNRKRRAMDKCRAWRFWRKE